MQESKLNRQKDYNTKINILHFVLLNQFLT